VGTRFALCPPYELGFHEQVAHIARMDERQTILNTLPNERPPNKSPDWNDGYTAAMTALSAPVSRGHSRIEPRDRCLKPKLD
jgi:hypothetical protein